MSTARQAGLLSETATLPATGVLPTVPVRRSVLRRAGPASRDGEAPFAGWRGRARTEELPAVPAPLRHLAARRPSRRTRVRRHLRGALVGTLLAVVAVTGLSAYAAAGVTDARQAAPDHARSHVPAPR